MVKCKDCAMLGMLNLSGRRVPFSSNSRETCGYKDEHGRSYSVTEIYCWRKKRSFEGEDSLKTAIAVEIDCGSFENCIPGTTPPEVEEMKLREDMAELQRAMHKFSIQLAALQETHHQENQSWTKLYTVGTIALAAIGAVTGVISLLTQHSH